MHYKLMKSDISITNNQCEFDQSFIRKEKILGEGQTFY